MRTKVLFPLGGILCGIFGFMIFLSGCGAGSPTPFTPKNGLNLYDINVQVHTVPQINMNQQFQVKATISSLYPIADLSGNFTSPDHSPQSGSLKQLLHPPSSSKSQKYALCIDIALKPNDPTVFNVDENATPSIQELPLISDMSQANATSPKKLVVTWNVTALDPSVPEKDETIRADVAFSSHRACNDNALPLSGTSYHLVASQDNTVNQATLQVINPVLRREEEVINARKNIAITGLPILLTAILGWISGLIPWIVKQVKGGISGDNAHRRPGPSIQPTNQEISTCRTTLGILAVATGPFVLGVGLLFMGFGPATIAFFSTSFTIACVGFLVIIAGALLIKKRTVAVPQSPTQPTQEIPN